jgi:plastocyanin
MLATGKVHTILAAKAECLCTDSKSLLSYEIGKYLEHNYNNIGYYTLFCLAPAE